jgi:hypothetical protein
MDSLDRRVKVLTNCSHLFCYSCLGVVAGRSSTALEKDKGDDGVENALDSPFSCPCCKQRTFYTDAKEGYCLN